MIRLSGSIKHDLSADKPFVLKVSYNVPHEKINTTGILKNTNGETLIETEFGNIVLVDKKILIEDNEIVLIFPKASVLKRYFRPSASANTMLLTEECDQRCIMCSQPPKNKKYDDFDLYKEATLLLPENSVMGITGGEPTLLKEPLFNFIKDVIRERPDLMFHILTNAQHFTRDDRETLLEISKNVFWGVPLYSHIEKTHDDIVSKDGAYTRLFESFNHLLSSGSQIELRTVLMKQNIFDLSSLGDLITNQLSWIEVWAIMQLEYIGYAKMNWDKIFHDHSTDFLRIKKALSIMKSQNINVALYNFPYCTVPREYRNIAKASISDWKNKFIDICDNCPKKDICSGFFEWYRPELGFQKIGINSL